MTALYSKAFAIRVIENFYKSNSRGCQAVKEYWGLTKDHAIWIFQHDQKRWWIFKKIVHLGERLGSSLYFQEKSTELLNKNLEVGKDYFVMLHKWLEKGLTPREYVLKYKSSH